MVLKATEAVYSGARRGQFSQKPNPLNLRKHTFIMWQYSKRQIMMNMPCHRKDSKTMFEVGQGSTINIIKRTLDAILEMNMIYLLCWVHR
jgi:hypothetical protein